MRRSTKLPEELCSYFPLTPLENQTVNLAARGDGIRAGCIEAGIIFAHSGKSVARVIKAASGKGNGPYCDVSSGRLTEILYNGANGKPSLLHATVSNLARQISPNLGFPGRFGNQIRFSDRA
jgi:hypothetical protein